MNKLSQVALAAVACCITSLAQADTTYSANFSLEGGFLPALRTGRPSLDGPDSLPGTWAAPETATYHAEANSRDLLSSTVNPSTGAVEQTWGQQFHDADRLHYMGHPLSMGEAHARPIGPDAHTYAQAEVALGHLNAGVQLTDRQANADASASWSRGFTLDPHSSFTFSGLATVGITGGSSPLSTTTTFDSNSSFASLTLGDVYGRVRTTIGANIWGAASGLGNIFSYSVGPGGLLALTITNNGNSALTGSFNAGTYVDVSAPVPEPETWLLLLAGAGIVGFTARKRQPLKAIAAQA